LASINIRGIKPEIAFALAGAPWRSEITVEPPTVAIEWIARDLIEDWIAGIRYETGKETAEWTVYHRDAPIETGWIEVPSLAAAYSGVCLALDRIEQSRAQRTPVPPTPAEQDIAAQLLQEMFPQAADGRPNAS